MATFKRFEDIESWQLGRELTNRIYQMTNDGPFATDFGLKDQIRRASVSVMANIAEGFERNGNREFINFLSIAKGSAGEVRSLLYVALDQQYINQQTFQTIAVQCEEISRKISGLMKYLRASDYKGAKYKP